MKIGRRIGDQEALSLLGENGQGRPKAAKSVADGLGTEDVAVKLGLGQAIGNAFDPQVMESERRALVERIKTQVNNKTYVQPSSNELATKFIEEIGFEIGDASRRGVAQE